MSREELASRLSEGVRVRRLERIGEPVLLPGVSFEELPDDERQNWLDVVDVFLEMQRPERDGNERLEAIDALVRLIVESDLGTERSPECEVLIGHLTGALFVHTEGNRCPTT